MKSFLSIMLVLLAVIATATDCKSNSECNTNAGECCCQGIASPPFCEKRGQAVGECSYYDMGYCLDEPKPLMFSVAKWFHDIKTDITEAFSKENQNSNTSNNDEQTEV